MSKYLINVDDNAWEPITLYKTKEQWDQELYSYAGYERESAAHNSHSGTRAYSGPITRYSQEPDRFPCLAITNGLTRYSYDGPDEINIMFIYDFEVIEEQSK